MSLLTPNERPRGPAIVHLLFDAHALILSGFDRSGIKGLHHHAFPGGDRLTGRELGQIKHTVRELASVLREFDATIVVMEQVIQAIGGITSVVLRL
jgi:hypothetical protein